MVGPPTAANGEARNCQEVSRLANYIGVIHANSSVLHDRPKEPQLPVSPAKQLDPPRPTLAVVTELPPPGEAAKLPAVVSSDALTPASKGRQVGTVLSTELVGGLRSARRHLARPSASEGHLRTELTITARRVESVIRAHQAHDQAWAQAATSLIHDAGCALDERRIPDGWQLVRAAQTELLDGLDYRSLEVERANVTGEALVLRDHATADDESRLRSEVWALRHTKDNYRAELDRRLADGARGLFHRGIMLLGVLALGAFGVLMAAPSADSADALGSITAYLTIVGLAMTGAAVSHALFTSESRGAAAVTSAANPLHLVLLRLTFGGVVGLLVVVLLQADIQNLINVTALSAYPWAILGGFSERYVDRLIGRVELDAKSSALEACRTGAP